MRLLKEPTVRHRVVQVNNFQYSPLGHLKRLLGISAKPISGKSTFFPGKIEFPAIVIDDPDNELHVPTNSMDFSKTDLTLGGYKFFGLFVTSKQGSVCECSVDYFELVEERLEERQKELESKELFEGWS